MNQAWQVIGTRTDLICSAALALGTALANRLPVAGLHCPARLVCKMTGDRVDGKHSDVPDRGERGGQPVSGEWCKVK